MSKIEEGSNLSQQFESLLSAQSEGTETEFDERGLTQFAKTFATHAVEQYGRFIPHERQGYISTRGFPVKVATGEEYIQTIKKMGAEDTSSIGIIFPQSQIIIKEPSAPTREVRLGFILDTVTNLIVRYVAYPNGESDDRNAEEFARIGGRFFQRELLRGTGLPRVTSPQLEEELAWFEQEARQWGDEAPQVFFGASPVISVATQK